MKLSLLLSIIVAAIAGLGQAAAQTFVFSATNVVSMNPFALVAADVNGDGKMDLVSAQYDQQTLTVLTNNGNGTFSICSTNGLGGGAGTFSLQAADFNGDGKVDLVCLHEAFSNPVTMLTNDGSGNFSVAFTFDQATFSPTAICTADVNGDGYPDLIGVQSYLSTMTILTNDGSGTLLLSSTNSVASGPVCVIAADVNGDGKVDLITANQGNYPTYVGSITVLTNNGYGILVSNANYAMPHTLSCIAAADMDGNGSADLITVNGGPAEGSYAGSITVLTNNGNGVFGSNADYMVGNGPTFVAAADFNGDGRMDLACVSRFDNSLTVLTNNGNGMLTISSTNTVGTGPWCLVAADVTGNGRPDLISADSWTDTLTVLLNSPPAPSLNLQTTVTNTIVLSWSAAWPGFGLQQNSDLGTTNWTSPTNSVETVGGVNRVILSPPTGNSFYRLFHP